MLKGISPLISPELLKVLDEMGHGDEIVLADANFPSSSIGQRVIRADGIGTAELLAAILPLFPLDQYDPEHFVLMEVVPGDTVVPVIWEAYKAFLNYYEPETSLNKSHKSWNPLNKRLPRLFLLLCYYFATNSNYSFSIVFSWLSLTLIARNPDDCWISSI